MNCYEELVARGLIAQVTNEEEIKKMVNEGKATFYIGFDPTADSLHVGHFMALCLMKRLQMAANHMNLIAMTGIQGIKHHLIYIGKRQLDTRVCQQFTDKATTDITCAKM